jgi:glycosyltransferase involved in cell wall biosynthesis
MIRQRNGCNPWALIKVDDFHLDRLFGMISLSMNRPRLLLIAFACDPHESMEHRNAWYRAIQASAYFDVTVFCGPHLDAEKLDSSLPSDVPTGRIRFMRVPVDSLTKYCLDRELLFYVGYRRWLNVLYRRAQVLEREIPFAATQLVSLCGYREPGPFWKLSGSFLWGPIGGTSGFPLKYLGIAEVSGWLYELCRNIVNTCQLLGSTRIKNASRQAAAVFAANRSTQSDLKRYVGVESELELEAGIDFPVGPVRSLRPNDRPLRILWAGRIRAWKGLPILIDALAKLPSSVSVEVRVVGEGKSRDQYVRLAKKQNVNHLIEWIDRPPYRESLAHYRWADVFAFTSLRDTSGTGLLEALAMGAPIIGLDHQGARDIMTDQSCVRITTKSFGASSSEFANAIEKMASDADYLKSLSDHACRRAELYQWSTRQGPVEERYKSIASSCSVNVPEAQQPLNSSSIGIRPAIGI